MGAYTGLNSFFKGHLCDYAIKFGYHKSNILILEGDSRALRNNYPDIYENLLSCNHHSDHRTPMQYGQDLVASWIFEDFFLKSMKKAPFSIELSGADSNRIILPSQNTSTSTDFIISSQSNIQIPLEIVNDYTDFWARKQKLHLRDNKYLQLQKKQSLLLAIVITPNIRKYALFDFRYQIPARYISSHKPYGYKPAYEIDVPPENLMDFTQKNIISHITQILDEGVDV